MHRSGGQLAAAPGPERDTQLAIRNVPTVPRHIAPTLAQATMSRGDVSTERRGRGGPSRLREAPRSQGAASGGDSRCPPDTASPVSAPSLVASASRCAQSVPIPKFMPGAAATIASSEGDRHTPRRIDRSIRPVGEEQCNAAERR